MWTAPLLLLLSVAQTPDRLEVGPSYLNLAVGESRKVTAVVRDASGAAIDGLQLRWMTAQPEIASVDPAGNVLAVSPGEARIGVRVGGVMGFVRVTVAAPAPATIEARLLGGGLLVGASAPLEVVGRGPAGAVLKGATFRYSSTDPAVADVDARGRVRGRRAGSAFIQVSSGDAQTRVSVRVRDGEIGDVSLDPPDAQVRTGDVVRFSAKAGVDLYPEWSVAGVGAEIRGEGGTGVFVAEEPGEYRVTAVYGDGAATALVTASARIEEAELIQVGRGASAEHHSGDTWVFEGADGRDYAYVGTFMYDWMKAWDVTDPSRPVLTDSVQLDARRINDVKIHSSNRLGILTREGASDRRNGIVILDLAEPAHPRVLTEYKETVSGGVHNVWIEGDLIYAVHNGTSDIHIIDISTPSAPKEVGRWGMPDSDHKSLHDVIVQDGYAYLSYWDDGAVTLDVGAGTHGGTPTEPVFVSAFSYPSGNTHTAWRSGRYLFVGDEIFPDDWNPEAPIEARGYIHVLDMQDPEHPVEVAKYEVPEAGAHNIWVEGDRLYVGYYQAGLRVVDISGELSGDLYRQGREIAVLKTVDGESTVPNWGMTWGAQIHKGHIFTSDLNSGLWVAKLVEGRRPVS